MVVWVTSGCSWTTCSVIIIQHFVLNAVHCSVQSTLVHQLPKDQETYGEVRENYCETWLCITFQPRLQSWPRKIPPLNNDSSALTPLEHDLIQDPGTICVLQPPTTAYVRLPLIVVEKNQTSWTHFEKKTIIH